MYVLKFRGAGQGPKALVAELTSGEIGRALGLQVPEIVFVELDPELARTEPDPEIHALILDSAGLNLALDYLPGAVTYDPLAEQPDPDLASRIVWFDAFVSNVDRSVRNTNMLTWHRRLWLIDHGATLYFHHAPEWQRGVARPRDRFTMIKQHVLLRHAARLTAIDDEMVKTLTGHAIDTILDWIPESWSSAANPGRELRDVRNAYADYLHDRMRPPRAFVEEAVGAR